LKAKFLHLAILSYILLACFFPIQVKGQETIAKGNVISGQVSSDRPRHYYLSENLVKGSFVILSVKRISGEGKFTLSKGPKVIGEYSVLAQAATFSPFRLQFYPFALPENGTSYMFNITSFSADFEFSFFYDVTGNLTAKNYKTIPLESGAVGYHADLDRGDRLLLNLTAPEDAEFDLLVMPSFSIGSSDYVFSAMLSSFYTPSPKTVEFVTDYEARFLILVIATAGAGNFTLLSSHTVNPVEDGLKFLMTRTDSLNNLVENLIFICVASLFIAASNLYLYLRLRKKLSTKKVAENSKNNSSADPHETENKG